MHTLLALLKAETAPQHLRLECDLGVLHEGMNRTAHRDLVRRLYGFYHHWEARALPLLEAGHPGLTAGRTKVPLLQRDLLQPGDSQEEVAALPV